MDRTRRLLDYYLPPKAGYVLESLVATTYQIDFEFLEEELLAAALGVRSPVSRLRAFRSELERQLQKCEASILFDLGGCERLARVSPRIDAIPVAGRKLHSKISLLMWTREKVIGQSAPDKLIRLIIGSANLTRQGFRHNYECVVAVDFGGASKSPRVLLSKAIELVRSIGADTRAPQLQRQMEAMAAHAAALPDGVARADDPIAIVTAEEVVDAMRRTWDELKTDQPERATIVSPFWFAGASAAEGLTQLFERLGSPKVVELVCRGERGSDGVSWSPVFDGEVARQVKNACPNRLFLRPTLPDCGIGKLALDSADDGDEMEEQAIASKRKREHSKDEEPQRALHAKMILLDGSAGSVLYVGSSNCTRRGLALGGPTNHEAGLVYRLTPSQRKQIAGLLEFAGPACEVTPHVTPGTVQPPVHEEMPRPYFLSEVVAKGTVIRIEFRDLVPCDLQILMPIPTKSGSDHFWLLFQATPDDVANSRSIEVDLIHCPRCDEHLILLEHDEMKQEVMPHVFVEIRWGMNRATFPVRFDDKAELPLLLLGRTATEGELIDYFLLGRQPDDSDGGAGAGETTTAATDADVPLDTSGILAYFIRRFVQALPGIEAEVQRAAYSRAALDAALRGPTSPLELAERAYGSLRGPRKLGEPEKTPIAVGFQLTEILAAIRRCRARISVGELLTCFDAVELRCRQLLDSVVSENEELRETTFCNYRKLVLGDES